MFMTTGVFSRYCGYPGMVTVNPYMSRSSHWRGITSTLIPTGTSAPSDVALSQSLLPRSVDLGLDGSGGDNGVV